MTESKRCSEFNSLTDPFEYVICAEGGVAGDDRFRRRGEYEPVPLLIANNLFSSSHCRLFMSLYNLLYGVLVCVRAWVHSVVVESVSR